MKEIFTQWKYTKMVVLTAMTAAIYAAILILFKIFTIIPSLTEIRPGVVIPVVFGLFFGPAGAWGAAMGNLIGDIFGGTLTPGSPFGFVGNFFLGFLGYKLREQWGWLSAGEGMGIGSLKGYLQFFLIVIVSSSACVMIIAWGLDAIKLFPFPVFATILLINNVLMTAVIGPFLFWLLNPRLERWDLIWTDIMDEKDRSRSRLPKLGGTLIWIGSVGGLIACYLVSLGIYDMSITAELQFGSGSGSPALIVTGAVALIVMIVGAVL